MKTPARSYRLPGDLVCDAADLATQILQARVVKHPLGLGALSSARADGKRSWNGEGWDATDPLVISAERRGQIVRAITGMTVGGVECKASLLRKETFGGSPPRPAVPCLDCPGPLARACSAITADIAHSYLAVVDAALQPLEGEQGVVVPRSELFARIAGTIHVRDRIRGLVVLSVGVMPISRDSVRERPVMRLSTWHGHRVEFDLSGNVLDWRTTYRPHQRGPNDLLSILLAPPLSSRKPLPLSDRFVVPRPWWEHLES